MREKNSWNLFPASRLDRLLRHAGLPLLKLLADKKMKTTGQKPGTCWNPQFPIPVRPRGRMNLSVLHRSPGHLVATMTSPDLDLILQHARRLAQQLLASISSCPCCRGNPRPDPGCRVCGGYGVLFEHEGVMYTADQLVSDHLGLIGG